MASAFKYGTVQQHLAFPESQNSESDDRALKMKLLNVK